MEIVDGNAGLVCNYEALELIRGHHSGNQRSLRRDKALTNVLWVKQQCETFFKASPAARQTREIAASLVQQLAGFQLTNAEMLQILNIRPTTLASLNTLIEMMESRLTGEQAEQILQIVCDTLPAPSAARAADEPAPISHYARDQPAASRGSRQSQIQLEIASVKNSKVFLMDEVGGDGGDAPSADE